MQIIVPSAPSKVAVGQATTYIAEFPASPVAGTYYTVADSTRINLLKPYTNIVLLFDGTDYIVQTTDDGQNILINGETHYYSPASGFIPGTAYGVGDEIGGSSGGGGGGGSTPPAAITQGVDDSVCLADIKTALNKIDQNTDGIEVKLDAGNVSIDNVEVNTQDIEDILNKLDRGDGRVDVQTLRVVLAAEQFAIIADCLDELKTSNNKLIDVASDISNEVTTLDAKASAIQADVASIRPAAVATSTNVANINTELADLNSAFGDSNDASVNYDENGTLLQRMRGLHEEIAKLTGDNNTIGAELTSIESGGTFTIQIPEGSTYLAVKFDGDPQNISVRAQAQVNGISNSTSQPIFNTITRQWVRRVNNRDLYIMPLIGNETVFVISGGTPTVTATSANIVMSSRQLPGGILVEDEEASSSVQTFTGLDSGANLSIRPEELVNYKYALIKAQTGNPEHLSIRNRQILGSITTTTSRLFNATIGRWEATMDRTGHTYVVPLGADQNIVIVPGAAGTQPADLELRVQFTNEVGGLEENPIATTTLYDNVLLTDAGRIIDNSRTTSYMIQNKSETEVVYWRPLRHSDGASQVTSITPLTMFEILPKQTWEVEGHQAMFDCYLLMEAGATTRIAMTRHIN